MPEQQFQKILVVDDEPSICNLLYQSLEAKGYSVVLANDGRQALDITKQDSIAAVITDVKMPRMSGSVLLRKLRELSPDMPIIMITGYGAVNDAVEAMKQGATDYILKPFTLDKIYEVIKELLPDAHCAEESEGTIITADPQMLKILGALDVVARSNNTASVIIQGESGTGKELIAREIHRRSRKRNGPFVAVNCAAMPESLLESELFGHEQGAFTGAVARRIGKFELAHGGTLLLDEIVEMAPSLQVKLLRVLQEGEIDRIGSNDTIKIDVRVIATTNRNIKEEVEKGRFRDDLFYRLYVVPIVIPPLRDRRGDIPILIDHFLDKFSRQAGKETLRVSEKALEALKAHNWPGNVRELENLVKKAIMFCEGNVLSAEDFFSNGCPIGEVMDARWSILGMSLRDAERFLIMNTLRQVNGNRTRAAKILGISARTIRNKLRQYSVDTD